MNHFTQFRKLSVLLRVAIVAVLTFSLSSTLSLATHPEEEEEINFLTNLLLRQAGRWEQTPAAHQSPLLQELIDIAEQRSALLNELIAEDVDVFLLHTLPEAVYNRLPEQVQKLTENYVQVSGELTVTLVDNFDNDQSKLIFHLGDTNQPDQLKTLKFAENPPNVLSGSQVTVRGVALGQYIVLEQGSGESMESDPVAEATVSGEQSTIVILINFLNDTRTPWTNAEVADVMFNNTDSVDAYYQDTSNGKIWFVGDVAGWYTINYDSSSSCPVWSWASAADTAAINDGFDLSLYNRKVYVFPRTGGCSWAGAGTLGGNPSYSWIDGYNDDRLYEHELGHNIGVHHASSLNCGVLAIDDYANCSVSEYGDVYDTMGSWNSKQFNAPHKVAMGWIPTSNVLDVTTDGMYFIEPSEFDTTNYQVLKINKPDTGEHYYIGFRQAIGFDATMPAGIISGASIHIWNGGITKQTKFVDTEPSTSTFSDAALIDNGEFIDQINGITIYQLNHDANQVTVQVTFGEIPCNQANPTVSITPNSQTGSAGDTLAYTVSVLNNDGTGCSSSTFDLASEVSPGWGASLNPATLTIGPGASSVSTVSVTSPINEQNGSYLIEVWATNQIDAVHNGYDAATYIVFTDTTSPDVTITDPTDGADLSSNTTISADVTDIGTVERVEFYIDGSLKYTDYSSPYGYTWKINKESKGAHTILVMGFDEAGNEGSDTIPVTKVSGGKDGGGNGGKGGNGGCRGKSCK